MFMPQFTPRNNNVKGYFTSKVEEPSTWTSILDRQKNGKVQVTSFKRLKNYFLYSEADYSVPENGLGRLILTKDDEFVYEIQAGADERIGEYIWLAYDNQSNTEPGVIIAYSRETKTIVDDESTSLYSIGGVRVQKFYA